MFGAFTKLFLMLDFLAPTMHLNVNGSWAVKTYTGVFFSLFCLGLGTYFTLVQIIEFFDTSSPFIAQELRFRREYPEIDLVKNRHIPIFFAFHNDDEIIPFKNYQSYITARFRMITYKSPSNPDGIFTVEKLDVPIVSCGTMIEKGLLDLKAYPGLRVYEDSIPEFGICIDPTGLNLTVVGSNSDKYQSFAFLQIYPCSLSEGEGCQPKEVINRMWIQVLKPVSGLNLADKENPANHDINADDFFAINTDLNQHYQINLINNRVIDNQGFLFPVKEKVSFTSYDPIMFSTQWRNGSKIMTTKEEIDNREVPAYSVFTWQSGPKEFIIKRSYNNPLDYLGTIGGLNSLLYILCYTLYNLYHRYQEKLVMVHAIYGIKKKPTLCCKKKMFHNKVGLGFDRSSLRNIKVDREDPPSDSEETIYVSNSIIDEAWDTIKASLDLVSICREVSVIKSSSRIFFKKYQRNLLPLVSLSNQIREKRTIEYTEKKLRRWPSKIHRWISSLPVQEEKTADSIQLGIRCLLDCLNQNPTVQPGLSAQQGKPLSPQRKNNQVLETLEIEINMWLLNSLKESAKLLDLPFLIPGHSVVELYPSQTEEQERVMSSARPLNGEAPKRLMSSLKKKTIGSIGKMSKP